MNRNVEIKAHVDDLGTLEARTAPLAQHGPELLEQVDTFFRVPRGRLKLRSFPGGDAELIFYERAAGRDARECQYWRVPVQNAEAQIELLEAAFGIRARVEKRRTLYLVGATRVHLDRVHGLGDFLELEVVLTPSQTIEEGQRIAEELMRTLGVRAEQLIVSAYVDLLEDRWPHGTASV